MISITHSCESPLLAGLLTEASTTSAVTILQPRTARDQSENARFQVEHNEGVREPFQSLRKERGEINRVVVF